MAGFNSIDFSSSLGESLNLTTNTEEIDNENENENNSTTPNPEYLNANDNSVFNTLRRPRKIAGGGVLQYPIDLDTDIQDYFEIQIFKYRAAKRLPRINEDVENAAGGIYARSNLRGLRQNQRLQDLQSTIQLPIPNSVKDQNAIPSFISNLKFAHAAAHSGSLDTVVGPPKTTSHVENTPEERKKLGIPENLIRCSVGIEHIDDIKNDFDQALNKL